MVWIRVGRSCDRADQAKVENATSGDVANYREARISSLQGVSQLLKQSDWAQIQDFKWYHNDDYIYWKVNKITFYNLQLFVLKSEIICQEES